MSIRMKMRAKIVGKKFIDYLNTKFIVFQHHLSILFIEQILSPKRNIENRKQQVKRSDGFMNH
jgi:hypothetical protein